MTDTVRRPFPSARRAVPVADGRVRVDLYELMTPEVARKFADEVLSAANEAEAKGFRHLRAQAAEDLVRDLPAGTPLRDFVSLRLFVVAGEPHALRQVWSIPSAEHPKAEPTWGSAAFWANEHGCQFEVLPWTTRDGAAVV
jgi:hypothetical protein